MLANIATRLIIDEENNKVYLSVEGKIDKATKQEKEELKNKLTDAFACILGLDNNFSGTVINDFESDQEVIEIPEAFMETVEEIPDEQQTKVEVKQDTKVQTKKEDKKPSTTNKTKHNKQNEEGSTQDIKNSNKSVSETDQEEVIKLTYGLHVGKTPAQVIDEKGDEGIKYFNEYMIPSLEKNKSRFPKNEKIIEAIKAAIAAIEKNQEDGSVDIDSADDDLTFDDWVRKLEGFCLDIGDYDINIPRDFCEKLGTNYDDEIKKENKDLLINIYKNISENKKNT